MNIPIAHSATALVTCLDYVASSPTPPTVTAAYLAEGGLGSTQNRELKRILQLLGFIDDDRVPLPRWDQYRQEGFPALQAAVRDCYADLFAACPDIPLTYPDEALRHFFSPPRTKGSPTSRERAFRTFCKLTQLAGLETPKAHAVPAAVAETVVAMPPTLVIQLPVLATKAQYVEVFEALKETLF